MAGGSSARPDPFRHRVRATLLRMDDDDVTEELKETQAGREAAERELARASTDEHETAQHERRAEKAHYLREKLEERAASERES
jgi:hypothetical protein